MHRISESGQCPVCLRSDAMTVIATENLNLRAVPAQYATYRYTTIKLRLVCLTHHTINHNKDKMIKLILISCVNNLVQGYLSPLLYTAPSAISHQSRIDIKHTPFISAPLFYNPATIVATQPAQTVVAPIIASDTLLTPIAFSFFHNLPLARALEHPISLKKVRETATIKEKKAVESVVTPKLNEKALTVPDKNRKCIDSEAEAVILDVQVDNAIKGNKNYVSASDMGVQSQ